MEPSESPAKVSPTARGEDSPHDSAPGQLFVHVVAEHDYTSPELDNESNCRPASPLHDVSAALKENHIEKSGRRILTAVRRTQSGVSARRDSSSSWSTCSSNSNSSSSDSSSSASTSTGTGTGDGGISTGSSSCGHDIHSLFGSIGSSCTTTGTTSSSCSLYERTYIPAKDVFASNNTDVNLDLFGDNMETDASIPAEVQSDDLSQQQSDTSVPLDEKVTVVTEKPFYKVTRLSDSSSSSTSSERGGLTMAILDIGNNFVESADINEAYKRARDPNGEEERETNTWEVISKCMEAVAARVCHFRSLAESLLGDDYTPRDSFWTSEPRPRDNNVSKCSVFEERLEAVEKCLNDAYAELVSEENKAEEMSSPTSSIGCSKELIQEAIKRDAEFFPEETSSDECEEQINLGPGTRTCEDESNKNVKDEGQHYRKREIMEVCKSTEKSVKRVLRRKEILQKMSKTAEQYMRETKLMYNIILTIMNCTINVARPALEAERFLQTALRKISPMGVARAELVKCATLTSTLAHQILSYVDEMEQCRAEAVDILSDVEASLDEIQINDSIGDDIVNETSVLKDDIHMLADDMSSVCLETLKEKRDDVKFKAGSVEFLLRGGQKDSAVMEDLYRKCSSVWLQLLASLVTVTSSSVKALITATNALEALSKQKLP